MNEIKSKVEIRTEQHKTNNLFQDIFMFAKYTCKQKKFVCTLLRLAEKPAVNFVCHAKKHICMLLWLAAKLAINFLKPAISQKKIWLGYR